MPAYLSSRLAYNDQPVNDCYGNKTASLDVPITRVIPPRTGARAKVASWRYTAAGTAHTLTMMPALDSAKVATEAAVSATTLTVDDQLVGLDGGVIAAADWIVVQLEDGTWVTATVSSVSGNIITVAAAFSATKKVLKNSKVYFMGAPADHTDRQFVLTASTSTEFIGSDLRVCSGTAAMNDEPLLVHVDNITAAGNLRWVAYVYGDA